MSEFPAILIGGPPHSGKSVLAYHLTRALRQRQVDHYVLRAYPDGEGDWSYEADQSLVRAIRIKGFGDEKWVERIRRDIQQRHLPLIVDVGGKPNQIQESIFDECTHAILLWPDEPSHREWLERIERHGLVLLADLRSVLSGHDEITATVPVLCGTITGLDRRSPALGRTFEAVLDRVAELFATDRAALRRKHILQAPVDLAIDIERLAVTLKIPGGPTKWRPEDLPTLLDYLPEGKPLGVYGRAPCWIYSALAAYSLPAEFWQFDARYGWVKPPVLVPSDHWGNTPWDVSIFQESGIYRLTFVLKHPYLDLSETHGQPIPGVPRNAHIILDGKLPLWMYTALTRAYTPFHEILIAQPQIPTGTVKVSPPAQQNTSSKKPYSNGFNR